MEIIISALFIFLLIYIISYNNIDKKIVIIFKIITSSCFLTLGLFLFFKYQIKEYGNPALILIALVFGFLGDIILGLRNLSVKRKKEYFIFGLLMFFCGHILYLIAIYALITLPIYYYLIVSLFIALITILFTRIGKLNFQNTKIINYIYLYLSSLLVSIAIINVITNYTSLTLILFGAVSLFVMSDFLLSFLYFKKMSQQTTKILKIFNIIFYYFGQTLFALSLIYY